MSKKQQSRAAKASMRWSIVSFLLIALTGCSAGASAVVESGEEETADIELLTRFAIDSAHRYPRRVHNEMALEGTLPFENGYLTPDSPGGPVRMDCAVVDQFGVTFKYLWVQKRDYPRRNVEFTLTHPDIDTDNWRFYRFTRPPRRTEYRPGVYTWMFELEDRFRRNGTYTLDITYGDETLLQMEFLLSGCEA